MSFYRTCMRNASVILFVIAIVVMIGGATSVLANESQLFEDGSSEFDNANWLRLTTLFSALWAGASSATLPFFGSALLYALDRRMAEAAE
jgi:hypothetical protein